jgi:hypothetical protein
LRGDHEVGRHLGADALAALFDLDYHTKHADTIFRRVFGDTEIDAADTRPVAVSSRRVAGRAGPRASSDRP